MWGKLDRYFEIPQDKVSAPLEVVAAEARNRTPPPGKVLVVLVRERADVRPKVESQRAER